MELQKVIIEYDDSYVIFEGHNAHEFLKGSDVEHCHTPKPVDGLYSNLEPLTNVEYGNTTADPKYYHSAHSRDT
jgi:hypothetical protein